MPRTYDELVAEATATGTFTQYVGDGASVPWQVALPFSLPAGLTMWAYKQILDYEYPDGFKLHDWCYTPYGALIGVTRDEADSALKEYIDRRSIADGFIVYAAVRAGGGPYFGVSQTGYSGPQASKPTPNIPSLPITVKGPQMSIKVVIVFQQVTQKGADAPLLGYVGAQHIAGWSEHVWFPSDNLDDCLTALRGPALVNGEQPLLYTRSLCLSNNASILGVRLYQGGAGRGAFYPMGFAGSGGAEDIPQMALLCAAVSGGTPSVRRFTLRGIPDGQVVNGEFSPTTDFYSRLDMYFGSLTNFGFKGANPVTKYPIASIVQQAGPALVGLVTLMGNNQFAVSQFVTINQTLDVNGNRLGGQFMVSAVGPLNNQFSIAGWNQGNTQGGTVSIPGNAVFPFSGGGNVNVERITTRRVGRPFGLYRGRRSAQRRSA